MALIGLNGGLIGSRRSTNIGAASGLWTANEQVVLKRAGLWAVVSDTDAAAYIAAVEAADGQPLEDDVKAAINSFILGCKSDGIWTAIKASCILAGARTLSGALVPLVGTAPTNNNFVSGDYNRKTGLVGDGSTKYLDSNRSIASDTQNNMHLAVYKGNSNSFTGNLIGHRSQTNNVNSQILYFGTDLLTGCYGQDVFFPTSSTLSGFIGVTRSTSASISSRFGGSMQSTNNNSAAYSNTAFNHFVFARSFSGGSTTNHSNARLAFYSIGESLDLALLDTRVTTLINAIAAAIP